MKTDPIRMLAELVAIPSPSAVTNRPMISYAERFLRARGWRIKLLPYRGEDGVEKFNLIAVTPGGDGTPIYAELALCAHTDTVGWDPDWKQATKLVRRGGRLYGRGTCDMKGFIAATLAAVAELDVNRLDRPLAIVLTADEEIGCVGAKRLAASGDLRARYAMVGEPTSLRPVRAGKGYGLAEVVVQGREAHSAFPDRGASAIFAAAKLVSGIEAQGGTIQERRNPLFDPPCTTVNVGTIAGGLAKNIVPGECRFLVEWRPLPGFRSRELLGAIARMATLGRRTQPGIKITVTVLREDPGFETRLHCPLVQALEEISGRKPQAISFNSEAPQLGATGAKVVVFGPGDMRVAHRTGEFVEQKELVATVGILRQVIARFCGGDKS